MVLGCIIIAVEQYVEGSLNHVKCVRKQATIAYVKQCIYLYV